MLMVRGITLYSEFLTYNPISFIPFTKSVDVDISNWTRIWLWPKKRKSISFEKEHTDIVLP